MSFGDLGQSSNQSEATTPNNRETWRGGEAPRSNIDLVFTGRRYKEKEKNNMNGVHGKRKDGRKLQGKCLVFTISHCMVPPNARYWGTRHMPLLQLSLVLNSVAFSCFDVDTFFGVCIILLNALCFFISPFISYF